MTLNVCRCQDIASNEDCDVMGLAYRVLVLNICAGARTARVPNTTKSLDAQQPHMSREYVDLTSKQIASLTGVILWHTTYIHVLTFYTTIIDNTRRMICGCQSSMS